MTGRSPTPSPKRRSRIRFPPELPISARVPDIVGALSQHPVVIVAGATGSGKTTQLPKVALEMGRGGKALIGVTQPRRIAATSVAARVASELECELGAAPQSGGKHVERVFGLQHGCLLLRRSRAVC